MAFSFIIFLFLIKQFSFSLVNAQKYNSNPGNYLKNILSCIENYSNYSNVSLAQCIINETRNDTESFIDLLKNKNSYSMLKGIVKSEIMKNILSILEESVKKNGTLVENIHKAVKFKDDSQKTIFDYLDNIIANLNITPINYDIIFGNISRILQIEGIQNISIYLMNNNMSVFFDIFKMLIPNDPHLKDVVGAFMNNTSVQENRSDIIRFIFNLLINYNNKAKALNLIREFLNNKTAMIKDLLNDTNFKEAIKKLLFEEKNFINYIIYTILDKEEIIARFLDQDLLKKIMDLLIHLDNSTYIIDNLPLFLIDIKKKAKNFLPNFLRYILLGSPKYFGREFVLGIYQNGLRDFFISHDIYDYNIRNECIDLFRDSFFKDSNMTEFTVKYVRKFVFDSPMNKGDFMAFDNCLEEVKTQGNNSGNLNYTLTTAFVIGIFDFSNKTFYINTTYYEKYHYISNFCLPFGFKKNNTNGENLPICDDDDYKKLLKFLFEFKSNDIEVDSIVLNANNIKLKSVDYVIGIFSLIFLAIPLLIGVGVKVSEYIIKKKNKKIQKINKLIDDKKSNKISKHNEVKSKLIKKANLSRCHRILNNCFSFYKNGQELFNFNLNNTNFNNINGITYIKGLIGISIILNVFGLTYTSLMNIQMKDFGIWHFYKTCQSLLFFILYISYRYSPRVLFSCSGYTLVYKYLCYLELGKKLYFLKFIFLQSYKYITLYIILIIFRYSIINIINMFRASKRPVWELIRHLLSKERFLASAFALLFDFDGYNDIKKRQNLIYNFYIPINEIFFFIFGTILITLGYRFKMRIDFIIIGFIAILFIVKIILYNTKFKDKYSTIDYYNFDLGIIVLNPLYNLSYFLIGMYFGLINYIIQKGITNMYKEDQYKKYYQLEESNSEPEIKEENSLNINDDDKESNQEYNENEDMNKMKDENLEKYLLKKENNFDKNIINNSEKELVEQIKNMPFLKSPIQFYNINKKYKDYICYKILIFLAFLVMIFLCYMRIIFTFARAKTNDIMARPEYRTKISLEYVISNTFLNVINILDTDIIVFLSQWMIFLLFFKDATIIREFCNSIYWSFFVKSYFSYIVISIPFILCILFESESVIKLYMYNFIFFSLINCIYIFLFVIVFYSVYELPLKKLFKSFFKKNDIIEEEEEEEEEDDNNEDDDEKEEKKEQNGIFDDDEEEIKSLKN